MKARRAWARPLVPLYAAVLAVKDGLRQMGVLRTRRLGWPVVSVGSLSAGGAGKTPVVIALAKLLQLRGWDVDVLSRGYGREGRGVERVDAEVADAARRFGDEPVMIARRLRVPVWVGADRFAVGEAAERDVAGSGEQQQEPAQNAGARGFAQNDELNRNDKVEQEEGSNRNDNSAWGSGVAARPVHVLDDGFQHRGLTRAVDVVVVTEADLEDALLPAGNRRERLAALRRADVVVLREEERERVEDRVRGLMSQDAVWSVRRELRFPAREGELAAGARLIAFCAIARPEGFWAMLAEAGCEVVERIAFGDHHRYKAADLGRLVAVAGRCGATGFVTTEKDAVKLTAKMLERLREVGPVCVAGLDAKFLDEARVARELEAWLR